MGRGPLKRTGEPMNYPVPWDAWINSVSKRVIEPDAQQWDRAIEIYRNIFPALSRQPGRRPETWPRLSLEARKSADSTPLWKLYANLLQTRRERPAHRSDRGAELPEPRTISQRRVILLGGRRMKSESARGASTSFARARLLEGGAMQNLHDWTSMRSKPKRVKSVKS